jgi:hypothetical protein
MTKPARKPLPLFYVGDRAKVNVFGLHGSDRYGKVVKVGCKMISVELRNTQKIVALPFDQVEIY